MKPGKAHIYRERGRGAGPTTMCGLSEDYASARESKDYRLIYLIKPEEELKTGAEICLTCAANSHANAYSRNADLLKELSDHPHIRGGKYLR